MFCPNCGREQPDDSKYCRECGRALTATPAPASRQGLLGEAERTAILEREMRPLLERGFRVISRTPTSAQLVKPNQLTCGEIVIGVLTIGILLVVFVLRKEQTIYISVDEGGRAHVTTGGGDQLPAVFNRAAPPQVDPAIQAAHLRSIGACAWCGWRKNQGRTTCKHCGRPLDSGPDRPSATAGG
jgi:hypothetical protein